MFMVSIHPRLFRRRELVEQQCYGCGIQFQSTPAFSGVGNDIGYKVCRVHGVSIHPRLFRRRELPRTFNKLSV